MKISKDNDIARSTSIFYYFLLLFHFDVFTFYNLRCPILQKLVEGLAEGDSPVEILQSILEEFFGKKEPRRRRRPKKPTEPEKNSTDE